jgi:hypothetical protein
MCSSVLPCFRFPLHLTETESADVDAAAAEGGDTGDSDAEDAVHGGLRALRHPQGHALRQHTGQDEPDDGSGGGGAVVPGGDRGVGVLLRHIRLPVQPADQEAAPGDTGVRGEVAEGQGSGVRVHGAGGVPVVVGVLQETLDSLAELRVAQQQQQQQQQ